MIQGGIKPLKEEIKTGINNPTTMKELIEKVDAVHTALAKLSIPIEKYSPISGKLIEIKADLYGLQSKGKTKEDAEEIFENIIQYDYNGYTKESILKAIEYAQFHANKDGWVRVPVGSWIEFDTKTNAELFSIEARKNCLCKFDDGNICRFNDDHPQAILTHFQITP